MKLIRKILFPIVPIYNLITRLRNTLYDTGVKKSMAYNFPVICVGNLSVGGTGKTPMIEYLIKLLNADYKLATLSRGYKRKTKGFLLADDSATAETLGDEPFQFYTKFKGTLLVAVDSNRQNGIENLQAHRPDVILLDDAYQHRKVKAGFNILLTTYAQPYFSDIGLPTGDLREPKNGAKRANVIVVTKCPEDLSEKAKQSMVNRIKPEAHQHVFFSTVVYGETLVASKSTMPLNSLKSFTLVTGIANAKPLVDFLISKKLNFKHLKFKDHHTFTKTEIKELEKQELIITTEKDFMRLKQYSVLKDKLFYLPIEVRLDRAEAFDGMVRDFCFKFQ